MITLSTSNKDKFEYPNELKDITLKKYLDFLSLIEPTKPQVLKDIDVILQQIDEVKKESKEYKEKVAELEVKLNSITDLVKSQHIYPYYARVVSYFSGLTEEYILGKDGGEGMQVKALEWLYNTVIKIFNNLPEVEYDHIIERGDEVWYLPTQFMKDSTVIEFAETAQFIAQMQSMEAGNWFAMPKVMCVLVRKKGEQYHERLLKREKDFLEWNMLDVWRVCFFFAETNREIANKFVNLYKQPSFDEVKAGVGVLTERFGWYLTIKQLAESGIFNRPDLTPLHSAEQANLWEAFTYLSSVAEENAYQNRYSEVLSKKK